MVIFQTNFREWKYDLSTFKKYPKNKSSVTVEKNVLPPNI